VREDHADVAAVYADCAPTTSDAEFSVSQAPDHFSDAVNRAAFGGEIT